MILTKNFSLAEFTVSNAAKNYDIINEPKEWQIDNLNCLANKVLQPLRDWIKFPITITSGYRDITLNHLIGGSDTSQHTKGQAADFVCVDNQSAFLYIKNKLDFDQLIWEFGNTSQPKWIHVSYKCTGNRKQVLVAYRDKDGFTKYKNY